MPRPKADGQVFYLGRVRYIAGLHSDELKAFLESFAVAGQTEKMVMLQLLIDGGGQVLDQLITAGEDAETSDLIDGLLDSL